VRLRWHGSLAAAGVAVALVATAADASSTATASRVDLCGHVPKVNIQRNDLGFRVSWPAAGHPGARGHGKVDLRARRVSGIMCQVNHNGRSILVSVGHRLLYASHHAVRFGVPGNIVRAPIRVTKTTDPKCPAGTRGKLTVFASYNGVHRDSVQLSFPPACKSHRHLYSGGSVVTNVPPN
jgi:hypothetical protein